MILCPTETCHTFQLIFVLLATESICTHARGAVLLKILYKEELGGGTAVAETPEMERVKRNQRAISTVHYCC